MYRGEVSYLDHELGRLLAAPRFERAIVAATADHGESLGAHDIHYSHAGLYPDTIHVPLILSWPGGPRALRVREPVSQLDLGRTLLVLAGLPAGDFLGRSLLDRIDGASLSDEPRFSIAAHYAEAAITAGGWHLILHLRSHRPSDAPMELHRVELYELASDPGCERDLVSVEHERARRMHASLVRWLTERRELGWSGQRSEDDALLAQLQGLGYTTDDAGADGPELFDAGCRCDWCARMR